MTVDAADSGVARWCRTAVPGPVHRPEFKIAWATQGQAVQDRRLRSSAVLTADGQISQCTVPGKDRTEREGGGEGPGTTTSSARAQVGKRDVAMLSGK